MTPFVLPGHAAVTMVTVSQFTAIIYMYSVDDCEKAFNVSLYLFLSSCWDLTRTSFLCLGLCPAQPTTPDPDGFGSGIHRKYVSILIIKTLKRIATSCF